MINLENDTNYLKKSSPSPRYGCLCLSPIILEKMGCDAKIGNFLQNNLTLDVNHEMIWLIMVFVQ